jgi:hypothetical protein
MKLLIAFIFIFQSVFAFNINEALLNIHATLVPKIPFMDYKFKDKLLDNAISIIIFYDKTTYKGAKFLQKKIDTKYKNGIKQYPLDIRLILYKNVSKIKNLKANIYYLLPSKEENITTVLKQAQKNKAITFSYLKYTLNYGCMISLNIGKRVKPIINLKAIKSNNISLRPVFLDISEICDCGTI